MNFLKTNQLPPGSKHTPALQVLHDDNFLIGIRTVSCTLSSTPFCRPLGRARTGGGILVVPTPHYQTPTNPAPLPPPPQPSTHPLPRTFFLSSYLLYPSLLPIACLTSPSHLRRPHFPPDSHIPMLHFISVFLLFL